MPARNSKTVAVTLAVAAVMVIAGVSAIVLTQNHDETPDELFAAGMTEFGNSNYSKAAGLFWNAYQGYRSAGDAAKANSSLHWKYTSDRVLIEYNLTRDLAYESIHAYLPSLSDAEIRGLLDDETIEHIDSDGRAWYFADVAKNVAFRNMTLMHQMMGSKSSNIFKSLKWLVWNNASESETYFNTINYTTLCGITIPRGDLPDRGVLGVWIPAPINASSQRNITAEASPEECVVSTTSPGGDLGLIYLQISLDGLEGDVVINATFRFSEYQVHFDVDPSIIGEYDKTSELYIEYTSPGVNILVNEETIELARSIAGNEANPYLQAKLVYDYVVGNISYSHVAHLSLCALGIAESEYVRLNGHGDCGAQSMFYCALLRSLGIPARTCGGYQSFGNGTGCHLWAEFYLPNYGWVPVDVTVAEAADWENNLTAHQRAEFKAFFFGNLDPYRLEFQNDVDLPLVPSSGDSVQFTIAAQLPAYVCAGCTTDLSLTLMNQWIIKIARAA